MEMLKKNEVPEGFVDRLTALKMLDVSKTHFTEIIPTLNIETLKIGHDCYYKLSDIEKFIEDFKDFYDNHIPFQDVVDRFGRACLDKNGISPSRIPSKYLGVLRKDMTKFKKTSKCFKKSDIENLSSKLGNETDGYINRSSAMTMLDTTDNYIHLAVDKFNINTLNHGGIFYNVEGIKNAITEVEKFHKDHYSRKYVIDNFIKKDELKKINFEKVPIKKHYVYILKNKYKVNNLEIFYKKEDVDNYVKEHDTSGFVDEKTAISMFETTPTTFKNKDVANTFGIRTKKKSNSIVYNLEDINKALEDCKSFYDKYYPGKVALKKIPESSLKTLEPIPIPSEYKNLLQKTYKTAKASKAYLKVDVDSIFEKIKQDKAFILKRKAETKSQGLSIDEMNNLINSGKYVSTTETREKLSLKVSFETSVLKHCRDNNILSYFFKGGSGYFYKVSDIENLIEKRKEFFEKYIPVGPIANEYFANHGTAYESHKRKLKKHTVPTEYRGACELYGFNYGKVGALKKIEVDEYLTNCIRNKQKIVQTDKVGANPFETFLIRLADYPLWSEFKEGSEYTRELLINYIQHKLLKGNMSERTCNARIRYYINLTVDVNEILIRYNVNEIFMITTSEINLYMNTLPINQQRVQLYLYLKEVHQSLQLNGLASKLKFSIDKIKNPLLKDRSDDELENYSQEIYDFETYAKVFKYITDIDVHINKIVNEPLVGNAVIYASTWLYSMLHLNNAWRHGDCTTFPELNIKDLIDEYGITDIKWFKNNKLTLPQAVSVIFRVRQWEMRISKTQMKGVFFCSDDLAPTFATAVIILHLFKYNTNVIDDLNLGVDEKDKRIMNFYNRDNEPTEAILKNFFKESKIEGFKFASRKFNKTIMTYIYLLANLNGDAKALVYVQEIRRHLKIENSMHYVDFDIKQVELLSRQLFQRGEFGYIPTLMAQKLLGGGKTGTFEEITLQTMRINAIFGDIQKINNTVSFLNKINAERQEVIDMLSEKTFKETQITMTDMFARNLSSKYGSDIQCLFSKEGCQRIDLDDNDEDECSCFDCPYHIPSIYTLTNLCNSLANNYKDYIGLPRNIKLKDSKEYFKLHPSEKTTLTKKSRMQIGLKIKRREILLIEAIQKFGPEYVYSCLDIDREDFLELSDIVTLDFNKNYPNLLTAY